MRILYELSLYCLRVNVDIAASMCRKILTVHHNKISNLIKLFILI